MLLWFSYVSDDHLVGISEHLISHALKPSTMKTYYSAYLRFERYCTKYDKVTMPVTEDDLILYVSYLFDDGLKASSIKVYLAAIRHVHILNGYCNPLGGPRLSLVLKGATSLSGKPNRKLPITYQVLSEMWQYAGNLYGSSMFKAALSLAFYGAMRGSELCVPDGHVFDPMLHLTVGDV